MSESAAAAVTGAAGSAPASAGAEAAAAEALTDAAKAEGGTRMATAEELEEIKLGSASAKIPKEFAKIVKDLEKGFHSKAQSVAAMQKQMKAWEQQLGDAVKGRTADVLKHFGIDPEEFAERVLTERIKRGEMSPEQLELEELRAWRKEQEEASKRDREEQEAKQVSAREAEVRAKWDKDIAEAWKQSGLPQDIYYVKQIAALIRDSYVMSENGQIEKPLTAEQAASIIKDRFEKHLLTTFGAMDPEGILRLLGEDAFKRLREYDLKRVTAQATPAGTKARPAAQGAASSKENQDAKRFLSESAWRDTWDKLAQR